MSTTRRSAVVSWIVVDASALVELLLRTERAEAVRQAVASDDMVAPDLVNLEVISAFRRLVSRGLDPNRAGRSIERLATAALARLPTLPLVPRIWELRHNLTSYDASYVALAESVDASIVTVDLKLSRVPQLGVRVLTVS
jgi:predicted nucleic acid-binding protein